jgi:hypothetical protein
MEDVVQKGIPASCLVGGGEMKAEKEVVTER